LLFLNLVGDAVGWPKKYLKKDIKVENDSKKSKWLLTDIFY